MIALPFRVPSCVAIAVASALFFVWLAGSLAAATEPAIAFSGTVRGDGDRARFVLEFDRAVTARLRFGTEPRRLVVRLPATAFRLGENWSGSVERLIGNISFDQPGGDVSRVLIDLDAPVKVTRQTVVPIGNTGRHRLLLDLEKSNERDFDALALRAPVDAPAKPKVVPRKTTKRKPIIVLDPGHGGFDGGARGKVAALEKEVTLSFALILKAALEGTGQFEVKMTRADDRFVALPDRLKIARDAQGSLFVSIHADSLRQRRIRGATVYTLSKIASDDVARELQTDQNRTSLATRLELETLDAGTADILFDLMQRETTGRSEDSAQVLVKALGAVTRLIGNPSRSANFHVLRAPDVPSVLLELGYLSNIEDEKLLLSKSWQRKVAASITDALLIHFEVLEQKSAER